MKRLQIIPLQDRGRVSDAVTSWFNALKLGAPAYPAATKLIRSISVKMLLFLSATIPASFLVWMLSAVPNLAIAVQTCARPVAGDHDLDCDHDRDRDDSGERFRQLELLTIHQLDKSIRNNPSDPLLYLRKAFVLSELGRFTEALRNYDHAISLKPEDPQGYFYRGNLRFQMRNTNLALQDYAQAIRLNPNLPEVYVARAFVRAELGDESGAISDSDRARMLNLHDNGPGLSLKIPR